MLKSRYTALFTFAITLALVAFLSCSSGDGEADNDGDNAKHEGWPFDILGENLKPSSGLDGLALENVIEIKYAEGSTPEITNSFSNEVTITTIGENVVVMISNSSTTEYSFILSGTATNGSLKFFGDIEKRLYLNNLSITNSAGPAINIQKSKKIIVHLLNGTQNFLTDGSNYKCSGFTGNEEQAKGAFFSEGKLEFEGSGSLEVKGKCNHAIAVDNDFEMNNGKIIISEAVNDGIHANDEIKMKGGVLQIISKGDAIQSEKVPPDGIQEMVKIVGGKIKAITTGIKSHGIASEGPIKVDGDAIVQISVLGNGSKGIKSSDFLEIKGGETSIKVSGTKHSYSDDESTPVGIKLDADLFIEGGDLTIKSLGKEAKGINTNNGTISAGNVDIEAYDDGIKVKRNLKIEGGTVSVKSRKKKAIDGLYQKTGGEMTLSDGGSGF